jgi:hypothetical protein
MHMKHACLVGSGSARCMLLLTEGMHKLLFTGIAAADLDFPQRRSMKVG